MEDNSYSHRFNFLAEWFAKRFLDHIPYPSADALEIRKMAESGTIVYVHRAKSIFWHIALSRMATKFDLPRVEFTANPDAKFLEPWFGLRSVTRRKTKRLSDDIALTNCVQQNHAAELFLRKPLTFISEETGFSSNYVEVLVRLQRELEKPIFLIPHVLVFRTKPSQFEPTAADLVFGSTAEPGFLRALFRFVSVGRKARWEVGEAFNLKEFVEKHQKFSNSVMAKKVRFNLLAKMDRIERAFHGPPLKSYARMRTETLRDQDLQKHIAKLSQETGVSSARYRSKARRYYREIAARFDIDVVRIADRLLNLVWRRIYDGLWWEKSDIEKLRKASHLGPVVLVPSHKSHVDYMVMSQLLYLEGLMPPHVAAGNNLSFFPLGFFFRRGGAYFIRRSFKGDVLYRKVLKAYLKQLFRDGFTQEFFIEGGRSRTGKTLQPKYGLLSMMVESLVNSRTNAVFVPASITYEQLVEGPNYKLELEGGEKVKESASGVLRSARILKKRYGRVFVTFDEPINFDTFIKDRNIHTEDLQAQQKKQLVESLAHQIIFGINRSSIVTPTALIATSLFGARRRTLPSPALHVSVKRIMKYIQDASHRHARFSEGLLNQRRAQIDRALHLLANDGVINKEKAADITFYRISEKSALALDYYKNNIIHHFVVDTLLATAFMALGGNKQTRVPQVRLMEYAILLSRIFSKEFAHPISATIGEMFQAAIKNAIEKNILEYSDSGLLQLSSTRRARQQILFGVLLISNFVDAYLICANKLQFVCEQVTNQKHLILNLLDQIRGAYLNGTVDCPESVNKLLVENAISLFSEIGVLSFEEGNPQANLDSHDFTNILELLQLCHYNRIFL